MNNSSWKAYQEEQRRFRERHPWYNAASFFGTVFTAYTVVDCCTGFHLDQPFRHHVASLLWRAGFFTVVFTFATRWRQRRLQRGSST